MAWFQKNNRTVNANVMDAVGQVEPLRVLLWPPDSVISLEVSWSAVQMYVYKYAEGWDVRTVNLS